jgi:Zn-dependent protease with chaperone function
MLGFYALALGISLGLLYIPYAEVAYFNRLDIRLALFCLAGAGIVLWSAVPRPDRFQRPGPELTASNQPDLFRLIESVRADTRQSAPKNVFLILDVNAWVAERGGYMGIGSRRVMALGLPLMQILTVDQLRAVLVHEFGHYYGGDRSLGPWIQKTRMGILRTIVSLGERWIRLPFILYANFSFELQMQSLGNRNSTADALAARVVYPAKAFRRKLTYL